MKNERPSILQVITICLELLLVAVLTCLLYPSGISSEGHESSEVVTSFLKEYVVNDNGGDDSHLFSLYFTNLDGFESDEPDSTHEEQMFDRVFRSLDFGTTSYSVEDVDHGFLIVHLYNEEGSELPPPIGLWYTVSSDDMKICDWRVARLQPFDRYDVNGEFSEVWDEAY